MSTRFLQILGPSWTFVAVAMTIGDAWPAIAGVDLRTGIVLPLVLFWPGYVLVTISGMRRDLSAVIAFSLGMSIAVCVPLGLLLGAVGRLDRESWVYALGTVTIGGWLVGLLFETRPELAARRRPLPGALLGFSAFAGAAGLAAIAILISREGALAQQQFRYTEFWMVALDKPRRDLVTIGVNNAEGIETRYEIDVLMNGALIGQLPPFSLPAGESRTFKFATASFSKQPGRIEAWLYKGSDRNLIYRKVWVSAVDVQSAGDKKG